MLHIRTKLSALNYSICIFICYFLSLMLLLIRINSVSLHLLVLVYCSRLLFWGEALELVRLWWRLCYGYTAKKRVLGA